MTKPHIKNMKCFAQVARVIGQSKAQLELWKVIHNDCEVDPDYFLGCAFWWKDTPQKHNFWESIDRGINPYLESE